MATHKWTPTNSGASVIALNSGTDICQMQGTGPVNQKEWFRKTNAGFDEVTMLNQGKKEADFTIRYITTTTSATTVDSMYQIWTSNVGNTGTLEWRSNTYSNVLLENVQNAKYNDIIFKGSATEQLVMDLKFKKLN